MTIKTATCRCGQLSATATGDPVRISVCHCLDCKRRSGSAFSAQARWRDDHVTQRGAFKEWTTIGDSGRSATFRFCPECGSTLTYQIEALPGLTAIAIGGFADPHFLQPQFSVFESRKHQWVEITGEGVEHD